MPSVFILYVIVSSGLEVDDPVLEPDDVDENDVESRTPTLIHARVVCEVTAEGNEAESLICKKYKVLVRIRLGV